MYHYNFTNDLRITSLDEILKEASNAFLTDTVPSASEDKSKNNNFMTVGFYFNLKAKGNCAKLASRGNTKKVVLNFIKKFQFPNPRTSSDYENAVSDKILLAPMRDIVKLLHIFSLIDKESAYLTKDEIKRFIFYNDELAKRKNYNLLNTANQIIRYRKDANLPSNIDLDEKNHIWNQPDRQIREMIKTLNYTGCFEEYENEIRLKTKGINIDNEADLFEIINCNSYWKGKDLIDYQEYMDEIEIAEDDMSEDKTYNKDSLNRIVFGAPGTGKSKRLADESQIFKNSIQPKTDLEKIKMEFSKLKSDENFVPQCAAIGFVYAKQILSMKNDEINKLLQDFTPPQNVGYYIKTGAQVSEFFNDYEEKNELIPEKCPELIKQAYNDIITTKNKVPQMYAIGLKFSDYIISEFENNSPKNQINAILELNPEDINGYYINTGSQTLKFIKRLKNKAIKNYEEQTIERVTFHPNYSYAQFVGTYKPVQDLNNEENIRYEYVPGPFMRIYINAIKEIKRAKEKNITPQKYLLLIEEINRANVAAVFGDVFQLLDRDENGNSEYPIAASEDIKKYLAKNGIHEDELKIPSNMYIWATMNSADQGVFPMDTAFKRRWEFEYIGIDENEDKVKGYEIPISATKKVNWNDLRKAINNKLITLGINEDKLLGPFFLSKTVLDSALDKGMDFVKLFESKVLMYLFEDAAKMKAKQLFNVDEKKFIYSEVCKKFEETGVKVFKFNAEDVVEEHDISIKEDAAPTDGKLF